MSETVHHDDADHGARASGEEYDFVVVGSGAGGGPLAANLALGGHSVLLLEAGSEHDCPYYEVPVMQAYASEDPDLRWDFFVRHWDDDTQQLRDEKYVAEQGGVLYPRGSTIGGSTAVSAMITIYPHAEDWQSLAELTGDDSWAPERMRELFTRLESWRGVDAEPLPGDDEATRDAKAEHGHDGWLGTTRANPKVGGREQMFLDIIGAMEQTARDRFGIAEEISLPRDPNAADTPQDFEGMTFIPVAVRGGHRNGSRERVVDVAGRADLTVRTDALATKVLIEDGRAVGVEYLSGPRLYAAAPPSSNTPADPQRHTVRARKEVILAGGAYNTPQLLMLSGIGPRGELERHGIGVLVDSPGVGANLHDRYEVSLVWDLNRNYPIFDGVELDIPKDLDNPDRLFAEWESDGDGPYATNGSLAAIVAKSSVAGDADDLIVFSLPIDFHGYYPGYAKDGSVAHNRMTIVVLKAHTHNRAGSVTLRSADPRDVPDIAFRYFDEGSPGFDDDLQGVVDGMHIARDVASRLGQYEPTPRVPAADVEGDEQLREFVRNEAWGHHACGTAKIGRDDDPNAVLDGDFNVRGVEGLRVVDASVFPDIPGFFIASAVYLVAEKASDVILAQYAADERD
ncbi:GMC family oxidoreductase [Epidermidibacterium keratini]|uniref:GMC family oxidoreductase n=1 Tax=Epidermidibacterium keratini TaxID=1891644 RepID=A0A7L4YP53_9ACTN|nr:GMC oxidoreductase [Epidermidibacterium keratini]QHC00926.1 GMC family oxidoreductase [Epidermidibacterium keratini]